MENLMKQMGCANQMKKMSLGVVAVLRRRAVEQYVVLQQDACMISQHAQISASGEDKLPGLTPRWLEVTQSYLYFLLVWAFPVWTMPKLQSQGAGVSDASDLVQYG